MTGRVPQELRVLSWDESDRLVEFHQSKEHLLWKQTRLLISSLLNMFRKKGSPYLSPEDILPLPCDKKKPRKNREALLGTIKTYIDSKKTLKNGK